MSLVHFRNITEADILLWYICVVTILNNIELASFACVSKVAVAYLQKMCSLGYPCFPGAEQAHNMRNFIGTDVTGYLELHYKR